MRVVELVCTHCGSTFTRPATEDRRNKKKGRTTQFCSRSCNLAYGCGRPPGPSKPAAIPWLKPRNQHEQMLAEMICGAAIEFQKTLADAHDQERIGQHSGQDYWSGYWAALIDYGRRVFDVPRYDPGNWQERTRHDHQESATPEEDGACAVPEEALS